MDYREKYKQAIENLKKIKAANKDNKELVDFIEYQYPELKESKDERIREELISMVKLALATGSSLCPGGSTTKEDAIAWLEKQVEQKTANKVEPKFHEGDWITIDNLCKIIRLALCTDY